MFLTLLDSINCLQKYFENYGHNFYQIFLSNFGVLHASIRAEKILNFAKIGQFW
jgi:hypothetical protein